MFEYLSRLLSCQLQSDLNSTSALFPVEPPSLGSVEVSDDVQFGNSICTETPRWASPTSSVPAGRGQVTRIGPTDVVAFVQLGDLMHFGHCNTEFWNCRGQAIDKEAKNPLRCAQTRAAAKVGRCCGLRFICGFILVVAVLLKHVILSSFGVPGATLLAGLDSSRHQQAMSHSLDPLGAQLRPHFFSCPQ